MAPAVAAPSSGLLLFIRYAFMPNRLGYCGGEESQLLFEHAVAGEADPGLATLLVKFTGAVPYLRTIAHANGIADPFDRRVVDAYWIGNELLATVEARDLYRTIEDRFGRQLTGRVRDVVLRKAPQGARPHHLFHVIDVYRHVESEEVGMAAIDSCRVSWGRVAEVEPASLLVERQPVLVRDGRFVLAPPRRERVSRTLADRGFVEDVSPGQWVSIHWGWACEVLEPSRLSQLRRWTDVHLRLANQTV